MNQKKRITAFLMAGVMLFSSIPLNVLAVDRQNGSGFCAHHKKHTESCYSFVEDCVHKHMSSCYPEDFDFTATSANASKATSPEASWEDPAECDHECSEESGCIRKTLDCLHVHGIECGYVESIPGELGDGQVSDQIVGHPESDMTQGELSELQRLSLKAAVKEDPNKRIPMEELLNIVFIYVNGEAYSGGDLVVMEEDNFSYNASWSPKVGSTMSWGAGSWFEIELFRVPNLNLATVNRVPLSIGGIKVGEYSLNYNRTTGSMIYKVVFNRYIQFFDPETIIAQVQGSGKFASELEKGEISLGEDKGTITILPRPDVPQVPSGPGGTGWQPSKAPVFKDNLYSFGKGIKWTSGMELREPQIEWRVVFLEQLQKVQQEFMKDPDNWQPKVSKGNIIIRDTLDENQEFHYPPEDAGDYKNEAPFYLELPLIVPGTGQILNGSSDVGNTTNYDGPGRINSMFKADQFQAIDGSGAATIEEVSIVQKKVEDTPLSWTVTTDPRTRKQTLMINAGKMGTDNPEEGITWEKAEKGGWPERLDQLIQDCDNKIKLLQDGQDSPIALLHRRKTSLLQIMENAVALPENQENAAELLEKIGAWEADYDEWYEDDSVDPIKPLEEAGPDGEPVLIRPLPEKTIIDELASMVVNKNGTLLKDAVECKNYLLSLDSVRLDQRIYLENRLQYGKDWENAKKHYENAKAFYEYGGVYGFVVKVRSKSINTSMRTYENSVAVELDDKDWSASDTGSITFAGGIMGNYSLGDVVIQKADEFYDTGNTTEDIQKVEDDGAGLAGAVFRMYCEVPSAVLADEMASPANALASPANATLFGSDQEAGEDHLAHFLDKDASENGKTYIYNHTGNTHSGTLIGEIVDLKTDGEGKLALGAIVPAHKHWLVETKAPKGYYLDSTPIEIQTDKNEVTFHLQPNVSRSAILYKTDSFSGNPVAGAEFKLYKQDGTEVTGFSKKSLNGHETYWYDGIGQEALKTNEEGRLCIHGLVQGAYVLREDKAAPGYITPEEKPEFKFILDDEVPEKGSTDYDEDYHRILNTPEQPLNNDPGVAALTMIKTGVGDKRLEKAGFALFRFTGTEAQWKENPDNEEWWKAVQLKASPGNAVSDSTIEADERYFKTEQDVETISVAEEGRWSQLQAVLTDEQGTFSITDIPVGHYSVSEVKAPTKEYKRDYRSFYFTVDERYVETGTPIQLYTEPWETTLLKDNTLKNYKKLAQLALVKYDGAGPKPTLQGAALNEDSWRYTEEVLMDGSAVGLEGAVYKLFMRRGASSGKVNPDLEQLKTETIQDYKPGYDTCVAVGETDERGILKLSQMKGKNGNRIQGLNPEEYYLIEVKAPDGYLLDQTPIHFSLHGDVFEADTPGMVKLAENKKISYGIRLMKVDAVAADGKEPKGLSGAKFTVKENGLELYFTGARGVYQLAGENAEGAVKEVSTGSDGSLRLKGMKAGTAYTLTEIQAPMGYQTPDPAKSITIRTPEDVGEGQLEGEVLYPKETPMVTNDRLPGKVTLHKQAAETGEALAGAEFAVYETIVTEIKPGDSDYDPEHPGSTRSEDVEIARKETDENGNLTFDQLPWSDSYYLIETRAPEGYVLDQTKRMFSINAYSGVSIPIRFPSVVNGRGTLGEAILVKADAEDHTKRLEDAHFYLEKFIRRDADGKEIWVGYGKGIYKTDEKGEIHFLLPPGRYKLSEMKAPEGYVLEGMKELYFEIEDTENGEKPKLVVIDEEDSHDGVVVNRKGETGIHLKKTVKGTDVAVPGVTFRLYWEHRDFFTDQPIGREDVYFISRGGGNYEYAKTPDAGAVLDLVTNENGELYIMLPKNFLESAPKLPEGGLYFTHLVYEEIDAPAGIERPLAKGTISELHDRIYLDVPVENVWKGDPDTPLSISVQKTDGKSRLGLPGAEFELFTYLELDSEKFEIKLAEGVTDQDGYLTFEKRIDGDPLELELGETYYVRETKAPDGYVLDETIHEIPVDERHFDEDFRFIPIVLPIQNYQVRGSVGLTKVAEGTEQGLSGAEFELLRKTEESWSGDEEWEHYGPNRYVTGRNGRLLIRNLPYGTYRLIERAAPLGYLLPDPTPVFEFQIDENGERAELGRITNAVDPNPVRDVFVKKVAAEDRDKGLSGAEFELYQRHEDGQYHPRQKMIYVTDDKGEFVIEKLPVGSYALKELKAPAGYLVPEQDMTYFNVNVEDRSVEIQIENERSQESGGDPEVTAVTVEKVWEDRSESRRPQSVSVQLYRDGTAFGDPVTLSEENDWKHTWTELDYDAVWAVDEVEVPEGYDKIVSRRGDDWTITNREKRKQPDPSGDSDDSDDSDDSGWEPSKPEIPVVPPKPELPEFPEDSKDAVLPDQISKDRWNSFGSLPRTGDDSRPFFWLLLMGLSAVGLGGIAWKKRSEKRKKK